MARKLQFADELKRYEGQTAAYHGIGHKMQIKVAGLGGDGAAKKRGKGRKSSK